MPWPAALRERHEELRAEASKARQELAAANALRQAAEERHASKAKEALANGHGAREREAAEHKEEALKAELKAELRAAGEATRGEVANLRALMIAQFLYS